MENVSRSGPCLILIAMICGLVTSQGYEDPDRIHFPGPTALNRNFRLDETEQDPSESDLSRSIKMAQRINSVESIEEFLGLVQGVPGNVQTSLASRIGGGLERSNAEQAKPAKCMPELQPVPFKDENDQDPSTIYFPPCTRIKRCGGCCTHSLLSCQPVASEIRNFEVYVSKIDMNMGLTYRGKQIVPLEEHTKCKCDCRIKPEDCTDKQVYIEDECRCACSNKDEEEKCKRNHAAKLWDPEVCACLCRTTQACSTGYYFDQSTCRCREVPISKVWVDGTRRTGYRFGQTQKPETPVIVPLDAADPRRKHKDDPEY